MDTRGSFTKASEVPISFFQSVNFRMDGLIVEISEDKKSSGGDITHQATSRWADDRKKIVCLVWIRSQVNDSKNRVLHHRRRHKHIQEG